MPPTRQQEGQVDPSVQRGARVLDCLHRPQRRSAEQDAKACPGPGAIPHRPQHAFELGRGVEEVGKLVEDEKKRFRSSRVGERFERVVPARERACAEIAHSRLDRRGRGA